MSQVRQRFSKEFKEQAVKLAEEVGSPRLAALQLGIGEANIYVWRRQAKLVENAATMVKGQKSSEEILQENQSLKREVKRLNGINKTLRLAAAFFCQESAKESSKW